LSASKPPLFCGSFCLMMSPPRDAQVIALAGEVGGDVEVFFLVLRPGCGVAPEDGDHPKFVACLEQGRDLLNLPLRLLRAK